jgi:hypothetical protein
VTLESIIVCGLAGWRLAYFLVNERGLFNIGGLIRYMAGMRTEQRKIEAHNITVPVQVPHGELARMLECVWCTSAWTGVLMFFVWHSPYVIVVWLFAIAAVSVLANKVSEHG